MASVLWLLLPGLLAPAGCRSYLGFCHDQRKLSPARNLALDMLMEADSRGMYARDVLSSRASAKAD